MRFPFEIGDCSAYVVSFILSSIIVQLNIHGIGVGRRRRHGEELQGQPLAMSAIVTHTTAHPSESCQLIHHGSPPPNTPHALVSTYTPSTPFTPSPGSGAGAGGKQGKVSKHLDRSAPLRDSLSNTRFLIICASVWSSNLVFAFQSTAIPTLAPTISSAFNHAELAAYLGSVFSLASAGGESTTRIRLSAVIRVTSWAVEGVDEAADEA